MTYFPTTKLVHLAAARAARADLVQEAQAAAADNVYTVEHLVAQALPLARDELSSFSATFGEPMPPHLQQGLVAELSMWEHLQERLAAFRTADRTSDELNAYTARVRSYLAVQHDVVRMQAEMVTSCLVQHYTTLTSALLASAAQVSL